MKKKDEHRRSCHRFVAECGFFTIFIGSGFAGGLKPKEALRSVSLLKMIIRNITKSSYRDTLDELTASLHRNEDEVMKLMTLSDFVESEGDDIGMEIKRIAKEALDRAGFDSETGLALESTDVSAISQTPEKPFVDKELAKAMLKEVYKEEGAKVLGNARLAAYATESPVAPAVYISIDDIGVKRQKETRKGTSKGLKYVENTNIHIQYGNLRYSITEIGSDNAFLVLVAFLLDNDLLRGKEPRVHNGRSHLHKEQHREVLLLEALHAPSGLLPSGAQVQAADELVPERIDKGEEGNDRQGGLDALAWQRQRGGLLSQVLVRVRQEREELRRSHRIHRRKEKAPYTLLRPQEEAGPPEFLRKMRKTE